MKLFIEPREIQRKKKHRSSPKEELDKNPKRK